MRTPLGPWRAAESCKPSERRHPDHGVFFRDCGEPVPPLTPLDTRPSGRNLKSSPNPDRDRSRQRSTLGARSRAPSVDKCFCSALAEPKPATDLEAWPPRSGFRHSFAGLVSEGRLDARPPRAHHPRVSDAKRRSSTSAIDTIHKHDRRIGGDPGLSCPRTNLELSRTGAPFPFGKRHSRVGVGSGAARGRPRTRPLPTRLLTSEALPRPDWPGHLMSRSLVVLRVWSALGGA